MFLTPKPPQAQRKDGKANMKINAVEYDFLKHIREASPDDCKTIIKALYELEGQNKEDGTEDDTLTELGLLVGAISTELMVNGILKMKYENEVEVDICARDFS